MCNMGRRLGTAILVLSVFGASGCSLMEASFDASVAVTADVTGDDPFYNDLTTFDPNESQDFRDNKDKIEDGRIANIRITITDWGRNDGSHDATYGLGQIDVRRLGSTSEDDWIISIARWDPVPLVPGESFDLDLNPQVLDRLHDLLFEDGSPLEVRVQGLADKGPVNFSFEARFDLEFTARVL